MQKLNCLSKLTVEKHVSLLDSPGLSKVPSQFFKILQKYHAFSGNSTLHFEL